MKFSKTRWHNTGEPQTAVSRVANEGLYTDPSRTTLCYYNPQSTPLTHARTRTHTCLHTQTYTSTRAFRTIMEELFNPTCKLLLPLLLLRVPLLVRVVLLLLLLLLLAATVSAEFRNPTSSKHIAAKKL